MRYVRIHRTNRLNSGQRFADVTPPDVAKDFNKLIPKSTLYWIEKCGHAAMMEHPDTFNEHVHDWLVKEKI